jgi:hypothetical protein
MASGPLHSLGTFKGFRVSHKSTACIGIRMFYMDRSLYALSLSNACCFFPTGDMVTYRLCTVLHPKYGAVTLETFLTFTHPSVAWEGAWSESAQPHQWGEASHGGSTPTNSAWDIGSPHMPKRCSGFLDMLRATRIADTTSPSQAFETEITGFFTTTSTTGPAISLFRRKIEDIAR